MHSSAMYDRHQLLADRDVRTQSRHTLCAVRTAITPGAAAITPGAAVMTLPPPRGGGPR
jgi:hypothetical protein